MRLMLREDIKVTHLLAARKGISRAQLQSYMGSVEGPRLTDCQELHQISQIRLDGDLNQISPKPVSDLTD
jgi:hypothetical protein